MRAFYISLIFSLLTLFLTQISSAQPLAYVTQSGSNDVAVIDTSTNTVIVPSIGVGTNPEGIAITPDGTRAYVANRSSSNVSVIDTSTNMTAGPPIVTVGTSSRVAITPDGTRAYVTNGGFNNVSVIDTITNMVVGSPIPVGSSPIGIAITPDGTRAYVTNSGDGDVSVIDIATNTTIGMPITVGTNPSNIAITPDGSRAYVGNSASDDVSVIDLNTNMLIGMPIPVGTNPANIAITPDGTSAYVANSGEDFVTVIDTSTNMVSVPSIMVGDGPIGIAITPDGTRAYVVNRFTVDVFVIDTATNMVAGMPIALPGDDPRRIAITPVASGISLEPQNAENSVLTEYTVTATLNDTFPGVLINFEVRSGPNRGESSSPGECFPNADCTTDTNGNVSWTYTGGPNPGTDSIRASFFNEAEQRQELSNAALVTWISPISLSPTNATNEVRTEHTVTALIEFNGSPESGILVDFEIISGPNFGEPGECSLNADCTTDSNGEVSWTYQSGRRLGTDTIVVSFFDDEFQARVDSNQAFKTWILPERNIPTMSEWGMIATAAVLGLASIMYLIRRKALA